MKWNNAQRDPLPKDGQTVLISVNGVYFITVFDAPRRIFRVLNGERSYDIDDYLIYWTLFTNSPDFEK